MGKGDRRTRRGKIIAGSTGNTRPKVKTKQVVSAKKGAKKK